MASVKPYLDKSGNVLSYHYRCCVGRSDDGKQVWRTKTDTDIPDLTPKALEKEINRRADLWEKEEKERYKRERRTGKVIKRHISFESFINDVWWANLVEDGKHRAKTKDVYRFYISRILEANQFRGKKLEDIDSTDIDSYLVELRTGNPAKGYKPLAEASIKHYRDTLRAVFNYAVKKSYIADDKNPITTAEDITVPDTKVYRLSVDELNQFLKAVDDYAPPRNRTMMYLFAKLGLRREEVLGLMWSDIDTEGKTITIQRAVTYTSEAGVVVDKTKTVKSTRELPVSSEIIDLLKAWKVEQAKELGYTPINQDYYCFNGITETEDSDGSKVKVYDINTPMFPDAVTRWLTRFVKRHNLPKVYLHALRHTALSIMAANGIPSAVTMAYAGHSRITTTDKYYIGLGTDDLRCVADLMEDVTKSKQA